jgi:hypothetical protein
MARIDPARAAGGGGALVLYLEGPRDRGILEAWARRLIPPLARRLFRDSVILGGRRPARAVEHFRRIGGAESGTRGLCVLDRDDGCPEERGHAEPGLEFFTWGRRHIESYLLVPGAMRRALRLREDDGRLSRLLREHVPAAADEDAWRELDAKRLLAPGGLLPRALGISISPGRIARATRPSELHPDVHDFFARLRSELGVVERIHVVR